MILELGGVKLSILRMLGVSCCSCLLISTCPAIGAEAVGHAELLNVKVTLIDLDPSDGVQPWVDFGPYPASAFANIYPTDSGEGQWLSLDAGQGAVATFGRDGALATSTIVAGDLFGPGPGPNGFATATSTVGLTAHAHTSVLLSFSFKLSPMTAIEIAADSASMSLPASGSVVDYNIGARVLVQVGSEQSWSGIYAVPTSQTATQLSFLRARFDNHSVDPASGIADAMAYAYVGAVAAVPEPSPFAMLLAGLIVVGAVCARRTTSSLR